MAARSVSDLVVGDVLRAYRPFDFYTGSKTDGMAAGGYAASLPARALPMAKSGGGRCRPLVILLMGLPCAGKTTLATALASRLGETILLSDKDYLTAHDSSDGDDVDKVDYDKLLTHLRDLRAGRPINHPTSANYSSQSQPLLQPQRYIILESTAALHYPGFREATDLAVFVDVTLQVSFSRHFLRSLHSISPLLTDSNLLLANFIARWRPIYSNILAPCREQSDALIENPEGEQESVIARLLTLVRSYQAASDWSNWSAPPTMLGTK